MKKLHTQNIPGNAHVAANYINEMGWAEYVVQLDYTPGHNSTVAIFSMPEEVVWKIRSENPAYVTDPHHDDPILQEDI